MIGTLLNTAAVFLCGLAGQARNVALGRAAETRLKAFLGLLTFLCGFHLLWLSLNGTFLRCLALFGAGLVAVTLGALLGRLLRLQRASNAIGRYASRLLGDGASATRFSDGFVACALVLCANPLGVVGALTEGALGYFGPLVIKAVMDGVAALALAPTFRWGVAACALPVLAWQGSLSLGAAQLAPWMRERDLLDPFGVAAALLVLVSALLVLELKKVELANYLPGLVLAPLLMWLLS